ncbi:hypothetical protein [Bacillus sp. UMB0728]|uniref:hypothetical protein n=1 Tax=Bacillus sp. UMB0728 TaxID=2066052 RepID=UPI000C75C9F9|nr:hypothetical protein [Bacillus sp. UMB0728]PLR72253.1 hypothetical protein CYJ37_11905 [Bacillus sp. UMB0728]
MPPYEGTTYLTYHGDNKCWKCDSLATTEVRIGEPPASWNNGERYSSQFYCNTHFEEFKENEDIASKKSIERLRQQMLEAGMDEKQVNELITMTFGKK